MSNWTKITAILLAVVLIAVTLLPAGFTPTSDGILSISLRQASANPDWLSGWSYRQSHNLTGATGAGTNYQIKLYIHSDGLGKVHDLLYVDNFVKYTGNPILAGTPTEWDAYSIRSQNLLMDETGYLIQESGNYIMYYQGRDVSGGTTSLGRALSSDGISWEKDENNPLFGNATTPCYAPLVIKRGESDYILFYSEDGSAISYATSSDGLSWSGQGELIDNTDFTNCTSINLPWVIKIGSTYYMVVEGVTNESPSHYHLYMASSSSMTSGWSVSNSGNPIYNPASGWDSYGQANPALLEISSGKYVIWYNGEASLSAWDIGIIHSTSLTSGWTSWTGNPILQRGAGGTWDDTRIESARVYMDDVGDDTLRMWYFGLPTTGGAVDGKIGYATCGFPANHVYLESHCTNFPTDIAFTDDDGTTELYHWCEDKTADPAIFWVKVNDDLGSNQTIYIYYGKSGGSSSYLSGSDTFIDFDDFERGNDGDEIGGDWTEGSGTVEISTGQAYGETRSMKLEAGATAANGYITITASDNIAIRYRIYKEDAGQHYLYHGDGTYLALVRYDASEDIHYYDTAYQDTGDNIVADTWQLAEYNDFVWATPTYDIWLNDAEIQANAVQRTNTQATNEVWLIGFTTGNSWIDDFIVRKFTSPEPTHGDWGSEEGINPEITNTPGTNNFGVLEVNTTSNTAINYFTITNTGNCNVDVTIQGTDVTGGDDTWTLSDTAAPGENIYGLYAGLDDADDLFDVIVKKTEPYNTLVSNLAEDATQDWGLKIYMPTSLSGYDAQQMTGTITLVASESS